MYVQGCCPAPNVNSDSGRDGDGMGENILDQLEGGGGVWTTRIPPPPPVSAPVVCSSILTPGRAKTCGSHGDTGSGQE